MNYESKRKRLDKILKGINPCIETSLKEDCIILKGNVKTYQEVYKAGKEAATHSFGGVINDLTFDGEVKTPIHAPSISDKTLEGEKVDVLVIGGGVIGCATIRELSKYNLNILLVDKEEDVAMGASSRNDGCIHVGLDLKKGSQKLKYLLRSREILKDLCEDIDIDYREDGQTVALENSSLKIAGPVVKARAKENHIPGGIKILNKKEMEALEPNLSKDVKWGINLPGAGTLSPYLFTIALAESALNNGARISLNTIVTGMNVNDGVIESVTTNRGTIYPRLVINCAGIFSDKIAEMAGDRTFTIHPRKGTDIIMDKSAFKHLSKTGITLFNLFDTLRNHTKGGGVIPTIDCNSLIGPDAVETPLREDYSVSRESIDKIFNKQKGAIPTLSERDIIAYFSGTRASTYEEDFVVRKGRWTKNILEAAGIQSPGLTAAPAIAEDLRRMAYEELGQPEKKKDWDGKRKAPINTKKLSPEEWDDLIKKDPSYGHIVCRCEEISEGEIRAALRGKLKATTIDGVKRRVRAGMGRCQGGFCQPLVSQYIAEELNQNILETKKKGEGKILYRETKEDEQ